MNKQLLLAIWSNVCNGFALTDTNSTSEMVTSGLLSLEKQMTWVGIGEAVVFQNSMPEEKVFKELDRSQDKSQLNPLIQPTSDRAHSAAKQWIVWAKNKFPELSPYIVIPGDGGIIVEWKINSDFVSINFDEDDCELDVIFSKLNGETNSVDFSESTLEELLSALISYDTISSDLVSPKNDSSYDKEDSFDFAGSVSTTDNPRPHMGAGWRSSLHCIST